jgi:manganese transport protein
MVDPQHPSEPAPESGWRKPSAQVSLPEINRSIIVPTTASFWRKLLAFSGPGFLVAVGYMDPGNWATDLAGGAQFGYALLSVIMISNLMAILLQHLSLKLGIATGRDLAQACRDHYSKPTVWFLWILCEIAITACDLAEVIGSAIALQLLFGIPLVWGCVITAADVLAVLYLQNKGFRYLEALVITLIATIGGCFAAELFFSRPHWGAVALGFIPHAEILKNQGMLYISIGIIGATVMPHNLYLHSSIAQTRKYEQNAAGKREAIKCSRCSSTVRFLCSPPPRFTGPAIRKSRRFRTPINCSAPCSAWAWRAFYLPWRCWLRGKTPRSPARSPDRSSWKDSSTSVCARGSAV